MMKKLEPQVLQCLLVCLDAIEEKETELLASGDTEVSLQHKELLAVIQAQKSVYNLPLTSAESLLELLLQRCLVLEVASSFGVKLYRSRMLETIRLHTMSRQWFHKQSLEKTKTLVSDFRFVRRARRYPKRAYEADALIQNWQRDLGLNAHESHLMRTLLTDGTIRFKLAGFQIRSTERITKLHREHKTWQYRPSATIVCSGTGSGKTLSFYLPAITQLAHDLLQDDSPRVRILAIYPRNELLKDQFAETYDQVRKLDDYLKAHNRRPIRIGTYFGDTFKRYKVNQSRDDKAWVFKTMVCPHNGCGGELVWDRDQSLTSRDTVRCGLCQNTIDDTLLGLTREGQLRTPPDILFTSTEMLNRNLGNSDYNKLFGVGSKHPIPLVLMDEVHTYEGSSGAQASFLLKRWMKRANIHPHFVGLSATLDDAAGFFSDLTGTLPGNVELIEPRDDEMEDEGAEYLLALRGDPVSQTALLSTTIQASMLSTRMLDAYKHSEKGISEGVFGQKSFVFTDDLDGINRLYDQLLDAEGWVRVKEKMYPKYQPSLAYLRSPLNPDYFDSHQRRTLGQEWTAPSKIGHDMSESALIQIGRTSSQDAGVNHDAQVVVATASLEVGFNDPTVGAVIQHKAPRGVASYLQRKGRAGRKRGMRPWMYTILSDFGRDRIAFQQYEQLINPRVKAFKLPVQNSHIQKMQAAMATLDWLAKQTQCDDIWSLLGQPYQERNGQIFVKVPALRRVCHEVRACLSEQQAFLTLSNYIKTALAVSESELQNILWQSPRAVMMEFLPSLLNKLETNWSEDGQQWLAAKGKTHPLPEFISATLFTELSAPSLSVFLERGQKQEQSDDAAVAPESVSGGSPSSESGAEQGQTEQSHADLEEVRSVMSDAQPKGKWEEMGFFQGLKEFAPGRISKRFTVDYRKDIDWLVPDEFEPQPGTVGQEGFELSQAFENINAQAPIATLINEQGESLAVYSPTRLKTRHFDKEKTISETSNAFLIWQSSFFTPYDRGDLLLPPTNSDWSHYLQGVKFFTHEEMNPIELLRYTTGSEAQIKFVKGKEPAHIRFEWRHEHTPVAVGTRLWVDGAKWVFRFDARERREFALFADNPQRLKFAYVEDAFLAAPCYERNGFFAKWVFDCAMAALLVIMHQQRCTLAQALDQLARKEGLTILQSMPCDVFQMDEMGSDDADSGSELKEQVLHADLIAYFDEPSSIQEMLDALAVIKDNENAPMFQAWLQKTLGYTLAGGLSRLVSTLLPDVSDTDINVDHQWSGDELTVWISEAESGGVGNITRLREAYISDPLRIMTHFSHVFEADEYEQVDADLAYLLGQLPVQPALRDSFSALRNAVGYEQRRKALSELQGAVSSLGIMPSHVWNNMLHTRILRPGSTAHSDQHLQVLLQQWMALEAQFDVEVPLHIAAFLLAREHHEGIGQISETSNKILGLLWPRGNQVRQSALAYYNRFVAPGNRTERFLLSKVVCCDQTKLTYQSGWEAQLEQRLLTQGRAVLSFDLAQRTQVGSALAKISTLSIDLHGLIIFPRVARIKRELQGLLVYVEIAEVIQ
ncbi:DEAD/DEAH box helicase [Vibrio brasiliensis]|uniref:protein DpdJ n=1 Tax=Vibrio brasiliensis TaxID=170652 RepID=UPI001EFC840B|nr:protein DpdJ [Vibrio brasiliensis]MCG9751349.1 DEAD/DEAH box helicase [Vibrio brasiliensis]